MTPLQALQLLDNLASGVQLTRADHIKVNEAIQILSVAITPKEESKTLDVVEEQ